MGKEGVVLENRVALPLVRRQGNDVGIIEENRTLVRKLESCDYAEQGCLAAPRRPEQGEELALLYRKIDIVKRMKITEVLADVANRNSTSIHLQYVSSDCYVRNQKVRLATFLLLGKIVNSFWGIL